MNKNERFFILYKSNKFKVIILLIPLLFYDYLPNIKVCVCTCGKQENLYAKEFVEHYKKYGVDKIFIYDNNEEEEKFENVLSNYIKNGFVKIINYREKKKIQMIAFNHCYQENKNSFDWFIFYDMDEFIHLKNYNNIKKYLIKDWFNKCKIIYLNHVIHTDNNQIYYKNESLFKRFPKVENFKYANYSYQPRGVLRDVTKIIIRGNMSDITFQTPHLLYINLNFSCNGFGNKIFQNGIHLNPPDHNNFYFDHFYFKSCEEYLNKLDVGDVFYGGKRGYNQYWFNIYFAFNEITKEKLDFFENKTKTNLSYFRNKIY